MKLKRKVSLPPVVNTPVITAQEDTRELLDMRRRSFDDLLDTTYEIQDLCEDFNVPKGCMKFENDATVSFMSGVERESHLGHEISRYALGQLCGKIGVPSQYIEKCIRTDRTGLAVDNMNSWLSTYDKPFFVREYDGKIRGILSDRYSVCDAPVVLESVYDTLPVDDYTIKGFFLNEERLHLRMVSSERLPIPNEDLFPGFSINSSDIGRSTLIINFFIWKQVCTNGLVVPKKFGELFRQKHIGVNVEEFKAGVRESFGLVQPIVAEVTKSIKNTASVSLEDSFKDEKSLELLIKQVKSATLLSEESTGKIITLMQNGTYDKNRWGLINSITQVAQDFTLETRLRLEKVAGDLLIA